MAPYDQQDTLDLRDYLTVLRRRRWLIVATARLSTFESRDALVRGGGEVIRPADVPESPASPKPVRTGILALVPGLMLGVGLAFLRDFLDDAIHGDEDAVRAADAPVLGHIPYRPESEQDRPDPPPAERRPSPPPFERPSPRPVDRDDRQPREREPGGNGPPPRSAPAEPGGQPDAQRDQDRDADRDRDEQRTRDRAASPSGRRRGPERTRAISEHPAET